MNDKMNKPTKKGGARPGAGRPATGMKRVFLSVSCQPDEYDEVHRRAEAAHKKLSTYVLDRVLDRKATQTSPDDLEQGNGDENT